MSRKRFKPEQIIGMLREAVVRRAILCYSTFVRHLDSGNNVRSEHKNEFVHKLKGLLKLENQTGFDTKEWEKLSREFVDFVRSNNSALNLMKEEIWHYTADLGIRNKDQEYATRQREYVIKFIDKIEDDAS